MLNILQDKSVSPPQGITQPPMSLTRRLRNFATSSGNGGALGGGPRRHSLQTVVSIPGPPPSLRRPKSVGPLLGFVLPFHPVVLDPPPSPCWSSFAPLATPPTGFVLVCYDRELDFTVIALESPVNGIRSH